MPQKVCDWKKAFRKNDNFYWNKTTKLRKKIRYLQQRTVDMLMFSESHYL